MDQSRKSFIVEMWLGQSPRFNYRIFVIFSYFIFSQGRNYADLPKCLSNLSLSVFIFYFIAAKINDFSLIKTQDF